MMTYIIAALGIAAVPLLIAILMTREEAPRCVCGQPATLLWTDGNYVCDTCATFQVDWTTEKARSK